VVGVNVCTVRPKPKRRGLHKGVKPGWKKAIVQVHPDDEIQIFAGAQV
jgi:ribosomal protein L23